MVYHVGIYPYKGMVSTFNTETTEEKSFSIYDTLKAVTIDEVDEMYDKILSEINGGKLGCIAINMENFHSEYYDNEVRRKFINSGKEHGCEKIEIIDYYTHLYSDRIFQSKATVKEGDVVWMFDSDMMYIWQIFQGKAKFIMEYMWYSTFSYRRLEKIRQISKVDKDPDLILFYNNVSFTKGIARKIFPKCRLSPFKAAGFAPLTRARIASEEPALINYNAATVLEQNINVKIGDKEILAVERLQTLPFSKTLAVSNPENESEIKIILEHHTYTEKLPAAEKFGIQASIDSNSIISVKFDL
jgi:hypothetical protein